MIRIKVYTGAEQNGGSTSDVALRLIGSNGTTEPHILKVFKKIKIFV